MTIMKLYGTVGWYFQTRFLPWIDRVWILELHTKLFWIQFQIRKDILKNNMNQQCLWDSSYSTAGTPPTWHRGVSDIADAKILWKFAVSQVQLMLYQWCLRQCWCHTVWAVWAVRETMLELSYIYIYIYKFAEDTVWDISRADRYIKKFAVSQTLLMPNQRQIFS
jgi:hypothetical protein